MKNMFGKQHNFYHNGILYSFKSAKLDYVLERMPMYLGEKINRYFSYVLSDDFPDELFNDSSVERCSSFRVKYLKRGARSKASKALVKEAAILDYKGNSKDLNTKYVPGLVKNV